MVERLAARLRRVERDRELLLDPLLPDELGERARDGASARAPPRRRRRRPAPGRVRSCSLPQRRAHLLLDRQRLVDVGERALGVDERPAELDERVARQRAPPTAGPARDRSPSLSFSSITTRCAVFRPMPGIASKRARSSRAIARRSSAGGDPETIASATFGPIPETPSSSSNSSRSSARGEAVELERVLADVQVGLDGRLLADARVHPRRRRDEVADAADVDHEPGRRARGDGTAQPRDHAGLSAEESSQPTGRLQGGRTQPAIRRSGGASAWQIATASASEA